MAFSQCLNRVYCGSREPAVTESFWASALLTLAVLGNPRPVRAGEGALTFSWQAPSGCPSRDDLRAEIARLLGGTSGCPRTATSRHARW